MMRHTKIKATYETDIYISEGGFLCIRQTSWPDDEETICLSPEQARVVITEMKSLLACEKDWWFPSNGEPE